jgi:hypothetical protein
MYSSHRRRLWRHLTSCKPHHVRAERIHFLSPDRIEDCDRDRLDIGALIREVDVPVLARGLAGPSALRAADNSR